MASAASLASNLKTAKSVCLDTSATKKGGLFDWKQTKLLISDAMKIPTSKPAFPMVSLGQTAEDGNPSLHTIVVKISGLVNRLTRSGEIRQVSTQVPQKLFHLKLTIAGLFCPLEGLWRMYYCVLSQTNLTFFSGAANELNGKVEFHITVDQIVSVEDGPDITTKGICTIALRLHGTDSQVRANLSHIPLSSWCMNSGLAPL